MKPKEIILDFDDETKLRVITSNGDLTWVGTATQIVRGMAQGDWDGNGTIWTFMKNVRDRIGNHFNTTIKIRKDNCSAFIRELERIQFIRVKIK